jgi:hypothetical protein
MIKTVNYHTINIDKYKFRKSLGIKESKKTYEIKNVTIKNNPKKFKKKFR